ncbi:type IV secretion protein IcmC [Legionella qingyii]|uniref:Type IV secretion protein IcmC n=1 Tax=Legionella qingyii TaxID=2184757 RepID=A0A317U3N4_9GAMM|nr:type IV secretion protein IcmC [Legionella qingyii]PWY55376.1 type IV secretion protein IcmC [Legionella qingyii]RUR21222.1 type IV secretion protein IcmC [Legionella qingyii]RUR23988.1 type IV secretion protein IcmC [Legionella qingyii]
MNTPDLITIIGNLSRSLYPVQHLISGGAYILGILFFLTAISKLRKIADHRAQSSSQEKMYTPMMYLLFGAILLYLPTALDAMANTTFGVGNILTYTSYNPSNIFSSMGLLIQTAGVLWFVRGSVLVAQSSQPGTQHGPKGLAFIIAGVLAMNFDNTIAMLNYTISSLVRWTMAITASQGY